MKSGRPLDGIRVMEMAGLAPAPYCGMVLSDFGADVVVVDRVPKRGVKGPEIMAVNPFDFGKRWIQIDLRMNSGADVAWRMIRDYDVLIEPYRPGVMESLGLGPDDALKVNPKLIYARLTGWGQAGPAACFGGHDMNYIALSGALSRFRRSGERPLPPCNILGDFAGGGMLCAMGILLSLIEREKSGKGQVVDAAMVDGAAYLSTVLYGLFANGLISGESGTNMIDGGAPFYQVYETLDGKFLAVGAIEEKFYSQLLEGIGIEASSFPDQNATERWPEMIATLQKQFKTKTREEWNAIFKEKDACVTPILELTEVADHPHNSERKLLVSVDGFLRPAPTPRLSRTPGKAPIERRPKGYDTEGILKELGYSDKQIQALYADSAVG